jgi:hypothetical protein
MSDRPKERRSIGEAKCFAAGVPATLGTRMATAAEAIIEDIFAVAAEEEAVRPVLVQLRRAHERGEWTPDVLARIVGEATTAEGGA